MWARRPPFVVLTDVMMPGISGSELVGQLREEHPRLAALFMSGARHAEHLDSAT